jgi:signal transduction histidine kinase
MSADVTVRPLPERVLATHPRSLLLATLAVASGATAWVTSVIPAGERIWVALAGSGAVLLCEGAALTAVRTARTAHRLRERVADLITAAHAREEAIARLADEMLPTAIKRLRDGASVDTVLTELPHPADLARHQILRTAVAEVGRSERMRAAAMMACANAAGRVQALATTMLADLRDLEERCDEELLGDVLNLDHSTAQAGRLADSIAVLTGARSGRRWTRPIVMESILRGAMGRISAYRRVRLHSTSTVAVAGYAAEGVIHVLAELMDNAANFSPPHEKVHVYVEEVQAGVVVTIEDSGLVMREQALRRAEQTVSAEPLDLTMLSGTRLGLAVVGTLARKYRLTVTFRPSSRGGTGVVVVLPRHLLAEAGPQPVRTVPRHPLTARPRPAARTPLPQPVTPLGDPPSGSAARGGEPDLDSLPKRRRGQTLESTGQPAGAPQAAVRSPRTGSGARFDSFRQSVRRTAPPAGSSGHSPQDARTE